MRLGCHTGLVVVGEVVGDATPRTMALGDTPNIAARLQGVAAPNTLVIGALTHQLVGGLFACRSLGTPALKGVARRLEVFQVLHESTARTRLEALGSTGLTPLVGRDPRAARCSRRAGLRPSGGRGRAVLVDAARRASESPGWCTRLTEHATQDKRRGSPPARLAVPPGHRLLPVHRPLRARRPPLRPPGVGGGRSCANSRTSSCRADFRSTTALPISASLLSIPLGAGYAPCPTLPPEQQKQQTLRALLTILRRGAARAAGAVRRRRPALG